MMLNTILDEIARMDDRINNRVDKHFDAVDERFNKIESRLLWNINFQVAKKAQTIPLQTFVRSFWT